MDWTVNNQKVIFKVSGNVPELFNVDWTQEVLGVEWLMVDSFQLYEIPQRKYTRQNPLSQMLIDCDVCQESQVDLIHFAKWAEE